MGLIEGAARWADRARTRVLSLFRNSYRSLAVEIAVVLGLLFLSLHTYLFGNGYYLYADRTWPPSNSIPPSGYFSSGVLVEGVPNVPQFTRDFVTFPYLLFSEITTNGVLTEKLFVLYLFIVLLVALYLLAGLVVRLIERYDGARLSFARREATKAFLVVLGFANFYVMNANVDGGAITDSLSVVAIAAAIVGSLIYERSDNYVLLVIVVGASLLLLDSPGFPLYLVAIFGALLLRGVIEGRFKTRLRDFGFSVLGILPIGLFIALALSSTLVPSGPFGQYRTFSLGSAAYYASNLSPSAALASVGFDWSIMSFGPPTLLGQAASLSALPSQGYPPQLLLPAGGGTTIWLIAIYAVPALAFSSLLGPYRARLALVSGALGVFGLLMTQYPSIPVINQMMIASFQLPYIGSSLGTTFIQPERFLSLVAASYILGGTLAFHHLTGGGPRPSADSLVRVHSRGWGVLGGFAPALQKRLSTVRPGIRRMGPPAAAIAITGIVVFAGWQAFDGSFYPARAQVLWVQGNGVPDSSPFDPVTAPGVVQTFDFLEAQPGNFNIYWPDGGTTSSGWGNSQHTFTVGDSPKPQAALPELPYLLSHNLTTALRVYLQDQGVKFVVVTGGPTLILVDDFGASSLPQILASLNSTPQVNLTEVFDGFYVYQVSNPEPMSYSASLGVHLSNDSAPYGVAYSAFGALHQQLAVTYANQGPSLGIEQTGADVALLGPGYFASNDPANQRILAGPVTRPNATLAHHQEVYLDNWSLVNGVAGNGQISDLRYSLLGTVLNLTTNSTTGVILSYNGTLGSDAGGVRLRNANETLVAANLSFEVSLRGTPTGDASVTAQAWNSSFQHWGAPIASFTPSSLAAGVDAGLTFPLDTNAFTLRLEISFRGNLTIANPRLSWSLLPLVPTSPFGVGFEAGGSRVNITGVYGGATFEVEGRGSINGEPVHSATFSTVTIPASGADSINFSGGLNVTFAMLTPGLTLASLDSPVLVSLVPYNPGFVAETPSGWIQSEPGIDDINLFFGVSQGNASLVFEPAAPIVIGYGLALAYMTALCFLAALGGWVPGTRWIRRALRRIR
jgi:hypothetical protein